MAKKKITIELSEEALAEKATSMGWTAESKQTQEAFVGKKMEDQIVRQEDAKAASKAGNIAREKELKKRLKARGIG